MGCVSIGDLRTFLDGQLPEMERARLEQHVAVCAGCRSELETISANASLARGALDRLAPGPASAPGVTWTQIRDRAENVGGGHVTVRVGVSQMFRELVHFAGGSRLRVASSTIAVLMVIAVAASLSPVQTAAGSFLSVFRVKKFVAVTVDPSSLPNLASPTDVGSFTINGNQKPRAATLAEAAKAVGFNVPSPATLPQWVEPTPRAVSVVGPFTATFVPDLAKVRTYLSSIGATDVKLPENLDGATITLQVPPSVTMLYTELGGVDRSSDGTVKPGVGQRFLYLGATTSPTMSVSDNLDVDRIRAELLKVPGLPQDLVNQIKSIDDWRNTVVVPVVKGTSREVTVQGEKGLLVSESRGQGVSLMWLKGGIVYTLSGSLSEAEILAAANSLK